MSREVCYCASCTHFPLMDARETGIAKCGADQGVRYWNDSACGVLYTGVKPSERERRRPIVVALYKRGQGADGA